MFPALDATITAIASDAASAAGGNPTISCFDDYGATPGACAAFVGRNDHLAGAEISCRLTVSYAGFSGESVLLEELYKRGMALPEVGPRLHAGDGMLFAWHTGRLRRGRTRGGWRRCGAACGRLPLRA